MVHFFFGKYTSIARSFEVGTGNLLMYSMVAFFWFDDLKTVDTNKDL